MEKPIIMQKVEEFLQEKWLHTLERLSGVEKRKIKILQNYEKYPVNEYTLRKLYSFFAIPVDAFYVENVYNHPRLKKSTSPVGEFFRFRRVEMGLSVAEVANTIRVREKTIERLERGVQLPSENSYTMQHLFRLYGLTEEEKKATQAVIIGQRKLSNTLWKKKKEIIKK